MVEPSTAQRQVVHVAERIVRDYAGRVPGEVVRRHVEVALHEFDDARVQQFVPVLVDRRVRGRLRALTTR